MRVVTHHIDMIPIVIVPWPAKIIRVITWIALLVVGTSPVLLVAPAAAPWAALLARVSARRAHVPALRRLPTVVPSLVCKYASSVIPRR
ncbi:hypothetical protein JYU34_018487 [Plutella xylostella]|uniref:Uncharacterized protein n=1 Tax=Plutella xylostella TaxID=51655 RepID=A0ABQ7PXP5_PLUXY|nr:hypothetical protein JYU34_018487 [Plutella xylostella]